MLYSIFNYGTPLLLLNFHRFSIVPMCKFMKFDHYLWRYIKSYWNLISLSVCDLLRTHKVCHMINGSGCPTKFAVNDAESFPNRRSANTVGKAVEVCYELTCRRTTLFIIYCDGGLTSAITTRSFQEVRVFRSGTGTYADALSRLIVSYKRTLCKYV